MKNKHAIYAIKFAAVFIVYLATSKLGLTVYPGSEHVTVIWPAAGVALAAILLFGYRIWPAIAAALFVVGLTVNYSPLASLILITGNTVEPLLGAYLLKRFSQFRFSLERVSDVLSLIFFAAIISTIVGSTLGTITLIIVGAIPASTFAVNWLEWWVGDLLGDLVVAPFLLVWSLQHFKDWGMKRYNLEIVIITASLIAVSTIVFREFSLIGVKPFILAYLVFPLLIWTAFRLGQLGSVTEIFIVSFLAIAGTIASSSKFGGQSIGYQLLLLQTFLGVTSITFLIISAGVAERDANHKRQIRMVTRTALLVKQKTQLQVLSQAKDDFIAIASHQLKTPPTIIKQYIGMLLNNYAGKLNKLQRDMLSRAYDSNERQIKIMHDILNVAQIDTNNVVLNKEQVDLVPLINEILEEKSETFSKHKQTLTFAYGRGKYIVYADYVKLGMAIENILDNASKYTPAGKKVHVRLSKYKAKVSIAVKDEGIGFTKIDSSKIFDKFVRIPKAHSANIEGMGIGLYWSKKIVEMHGGHITTISKHNKGSTFRIQLPTAATH